MFGRFPAAPDLQSNLSKSLVYFGGVEEARNSNTTTVRTWPRKIIIMILKHPFGYKEAQYDIITTLWWIE